MSNNIAIDSTWVRDRFNLQYNNIFSNQAPGLEDYEISMYLNMAHLEIIDEYSADIDLFEKYRSILNGYIKDSTLPNEDGYLSQPEINQTRGIDYQMFELNSNY